MPRKPEKLYSYTVFSLIRACSRPKGPVGLLDRRMSRLAIVTGGGTGIGAALTLALAANGHAVIAVGRRSEPLAEVAARSPSLITPVSADIGTPGGRQAVVDAVKASGRKLDYLVQNAGTIGPIAPLSQVSEADWRVTMNTNVDAPLFLLQAVLPFMSSGSRVLHVSSGAAHSVIAGWGSYCTSKSAFNMMYRVLAAELAPAGISVGSVRPGVVETPMQAAIRAGDFPDKDRFVELHEKRRALPEGVASAPPPDGGLDDPKNVGAFLKFLLESTTPDEFSAAEWDIRNKEHHGRWTGAA